MELHKRHEGMRRDIKVGTVTVPMERALREDWVQLNSQDETRAVCLLRLNVSHHHDEVHELQSQEEDSKSGDLSPPRVKNQKRKRRRKRDNRARTGVIEPGDIAHSSPLDAVGIGAAVSQSEGLLSQTCLDAFTEGQDDDLVQDAVSADNESPPGYDQLWIRDPSDVAWHNDQSKDETVKFSPPPYDLLIPNLLPLANIGSRLRTLSSSSTLTWACDYFTYYEQLRSADTQNDAHFEIVRAKLSTEWQDVRTTLLIIAAADAAVYGFSSGTVFTVDQAASKLLILSAISAAFGLCLVISLQLRYGSTDAGRFALLARARYDENSENYSYAYFAITSRLPLVALCLSLTMFSLFLLAVAYTFWPSAVFVLGSIGLVLVGLQYVVRGGHMLSSGIRKAIGAILGAIRAVYVHVKATLTLACSPTAPIPLHPVSTTDPASSPPS
ncbi:hypothetical protein PENSPDRAFT_264532 [Peniophora sp. CONT]|nr:hypothetical protein PENSPDRAFT_264532 [Peniophora sp. CONT]